MTKTKLLGSNQPKTLAGIPYCPECSLIRDVTVYHDHYPAPHGVRKPAGCYLAFRLNEHLAGKHEASSVSDCEECHEGYTGRKTTIVCSSPLQTGEPR